MCETERTISAPVKREGILTRLQPIPRTNITNYRFLALTIEEPPEVDRVYNDIIRFCKQNNQTFLDDSFPHSNKSIGDIRTLEREVYDIVWLRPKDIRNRDGEELPWTVFNNPQPTDIEQGALGNCWFLSALAVIAECPEILEEIVVTNKYNKYGIYKIRLCVDGFWETVFVDDFFPCHSMFSSMLFAVGRKNQLWVSLIEKAFAKVYGSYAALKSGRTTEGLSVLTGARCEQINLELEDGLSESEEVYAFQKIWARLLSAKEAKYLMGCSCGCGRKTVIDRDYQALGLRTKHAYSILDVRKYQNYKLLKIRNPWGNYIWCGDWSPYWDGWNRNKKMKKDLDYNNTGEENGTFWISFEDFVKYFDSVSIAYFKGKFQDHSKRYQLDVSWSKPKALRLTVTQNTEVSFSLFQKKARILKDQADLLILVHKENPITGGFGDLIIRSERGSQPCVKTKGKFFKPGNYLVYCSSFKNFFEEKDVETVLVLHSEKPVETELQDVRLDIIKQSFIQMSLNEGKVTRYSDDIVVYQVSEKFFGWLLLIENLSRNYFINVKVNCTESENVVSSRGDLIVDDFIPPLHRKISFVLLPSERGQEYVASWEWHVIRNPHMRRLGIYSPESYSNPKLVNRNLETLHNSAAI